MKKLLIFLVFNAFYYVISLNTYSQAYVFDAQTLNLEQGLPHRNTKDIIQDLNGYIWISGQGNISRYDGNEWKVYNYSRLNIFQDKIPFLALDKQNRLWYAEQISGEYSAAIDADTDDIIPLQTISDGLLHSDSVVFVSNSKRNEDKILIATESGKIYTYEDDFDLVYTLGATFSNDLYITIEEGFEEDYFIFIFDFMKEESKLLHVKNQQIKKKYDFPQVGVHLLCRVLPENIIEIFTYQKRYEYYRIQNDSLIPHQLVPENDYYRILYWNEDYICYYTTARKLIVRDNNGNLMFEKKVTLGMPIDKATVYRDKQDILWMATGDGILKIFTKKNHFEIIDKRSIVINGNNNKGNSIRGIYQDDDYLWWGGYTGNFRRNRHTGETENFLPDENTTVPLNFLKDDKGHLWLGSTHKLYYKYVPEEDKFLKYKTPDYNTLLFQNNITKNHWIGTQNGWHIGDLGGKTAHFPLTEGMKNMYVRQFYQNEEGIWVATGNGLFLIDGQTEKLIKHYTTDDGLSSNNLNYLYQDTEGIYWIGTKDTGLIRWNKEQNKFKQFTKNDYLVNNNIYCIYEDELNRLWLPSDEGLMCFDKKTYETQVFLEKDGVANNEFNTYAHFQAEDGTLIFGGIEGITKFHPKNINTTKESKIPLYVNKLQVLEDSEEDFRDKTKEYLSSQKIIFSAKDRVLELQMSLLDYQNAEAKQYAYRFNNQQWTYTNDNKITIINPSYGHYTLYIKGRTTSGEWSKILEIPFVVNAPFYLNLWFLITMVLAISGDAIMSFQETRLCHFRRRDYVISGDAIMPFQETRLCHFRRRDYAISGDAMKPFQETR